MSRSDKMPARRPPTPRTTSAPIRCLVSSLAAAARSAVKSMLTTSLPFAARMVFKLMLGSVSDHFTPTLWSRVQCVYRDKNMLFDLDRCGHSRTATNGMGLWSNFKNLPNADWVDHAQARERG